jgi:hypothetical protein
MPLIPDPDIGIDPQLQPFAAHQRPQQYPEPLRPLRIGVAVTKKDLVPSTISGITHTRREIHAKIVSGRTRPPRSQRPPTPLLNLTELGS